MESHTHIREESVGNFACVMTQAVLAKVVLGTPGGCAIERVMKTQFSLNAFHSILSFVLKWE